MKVLSPCDDISEFLDVLKKMRVVDDKIVNALNTAIPSESFAAKIDAHETCKTLFLQLVESHANRDSTLRDCLSLTTDKLQKLKNQKQATPNDIQVIRQLRGEQSKMRELQTEINVEEVIRGRTLKIFNERCRDYYKPQEGSNR